MFPFLSFFQTLLGYPIITGFIYYFIIENASARPSHPQIAGPADRGAQSVLGVYA